MRYFATRDAVTNANLRYLDNHTWIRSDMSAEFVTDMYRAVIAVQEMLPAAVRAKFSLPMLYIGNAAYHWSAGLRQQHVEELVRAVETGLDAILADPSFAKDGDADLSDRPPSKGEELHAAVEAVQRYRGPQELNALRSAAYGTNLGSFIERLDHWFGRKRPSPGGNSIEYEIACVIGDIDRRASDYHHLRASIDFVPARRRPE